MEWNPFEWHLENMEMQQKLQVWKLSVLSELIDTAYASIDIALIDSCHDMFNLIFYFLSAYTMDHIYWCIRKWTVSESTNAVAETSTGGISHRHACWETWVTAEGAVVAGRLSEGLQARTLMVEVRNLERFHSDECSQEDYKEHNLNALINLF